MSERGRNKQGHPDVLWIDEANLSVVLEDVFEGDGVKYIRADTIAQPTDKECAEALKALEHQWWGYYVSETLGYSRADKDRITKTLRKALLRPKLDIESLRKTAEEVNPPNPNNGLVRSYVNGRNNVLDELKKLTECGQ